MGEYGYRISLRRNAEWAIQVYRFNTPGFWEILGNTEEARPPGKAGQKRVFLMRADLLADASSSTTRDMAQLVN